MGDIANGVLGHEESIVEAVWDGLKYPKHLWSFDSAKPSVPPFLDLIHRAELGYPLYDLNGDPLDATFIPALLPEMRFGYSDDFKRGLLDYFKLKSADPVRHPDVVLSFTKPQPQRAFVAQLIVRLRRFSMIDGVWKHGGVLKGDDDSGNSSTCIFYVEFNQLTVLSIGSGERSTGARSIFLNELLNLVVDKFSTLRAQSIQFGNTLLNSSGVESALQFEGYIKHDGAQLSLRGLSALFGLASSPAVGRKFSDSITGSSNSLRSIGSIKPNSDEILAGDDRVNLEYRLISCFSYIVSLQGLLTFGEKGIHTLWVVYRSKATNTYSAYAIAPGAKPSLAWRLIESSAIPMPAEKHPDDFNAEIMETSDILKNALSILVEVDTTKFEYVGLRILRELEDRIKIKEMDLFAPIDEFPNAHYVLKSSMISALSSCVSEHIKELKYNLNKGFADIGIKLEHQEKQVFFF
jgi:hypothetical protein